MAAHQYDWCSDVPVLRRKTDAVKVRLAECDSSCKTLVACTEHILKESRQALLTATTTIEQGKAIFGHPSRQARAA